MEEGYQQRLYEAQEHLQAIGLKLTKAGVASEPRTLAELFSGVSRQAESVLAGLSALPLSHQAMSDTLKFCNQLAEYASQLCLQMAQGEALTVDQLTLLENLRGQCVPTDEPDRAGPERNGAGKPAHGRFRQRIL